MERDQAPPVVQRIYDAIERQTGRVSPFFRMLGSKLELLPPATSCTGRVGRGCAGAK